MLRRTLFGAQEEEKATREGFSEGLVAAAEKDQRVVALAADLADSVKMDAFRNKFRDRFFEVGITEQAMSGLASGMAAMGYIPFMASYAMFSPGRNWEQIRTTIAYNNVPVKVVGAHAGISVGPDGATHQAIEDIAIMRMIPNMQVFVPCDGVEARVITEHIATTKSPTYLRLTREKTPIILPDNYTWNQGKGYMLHMSQHKNGGDFMHMVAIVGCGPILYEALKAAFALEKEGIGVMVVNFPQVKPLDVGYLLRIAKDVRAIVTVEEHQIAGGFGSAVTEYLSEHHPIRIARIGIEDRFGQSGKVGELYEEYGLTSKHIAQKVRETLH
ncbi:MAG: transketolase family protein [Candidatus Pacebacteria bacterium]|nr:transketolase family protein [Candidatus Paceibacterota bacterium]